MKATLSLTLDRKPQGQAVLRVEGSVDGATFKQFEAAFEGLGDVLYLVVDLAQMAYMSSSGFSLLIRAKTDRAGKKGDVVLVRPQTSILNILDILGLRSLFRVAASVEEALQVRD
jgi:anti-anti-sigma factor